MLKVVFTLSVILLFSTVTLAQQNDIKIAIDVPKDFKNDSVKINLLPIDYVDYEREIINVSCKIINGYVRFHLNSRIALDFRAMSLLGNGPYLIEPGDSITISYHGGCATFSGKGYEKFELVQEVEKLSRHFFPTNTMQTRVISSVNDYFKACSKIDSQLIIVTNLVNKYKERISASALNFIKINLISDLECCRVKLFNFLFSNRNKHNLSYKELNRIFDSTLLTVTSRALQNDSSSLSINLRSYLYYFTRMASLRSSGFDKSISSLERAKGYYYFAKQNFKGVIRERLLSYIITRRIIKEEGFSPEVEDILTNYYSLPGFAKYKTWVRQQESLSRALVKGERAPNFTLTDRFDNLISLSNIKNKIVLIDFWFTGCTGCAQIIPALSAVEKSFSDNPNIVFFSVSIDKNKSKWVQSIKERKYTTGRGINLYTQGQGSNHPILKEYNITSFPKLFLIDNYGKILENPLPDPRNDSGAALIKLINRQLVLMNDGPYVFYAEDKIISKSIVLSEVVTEQFDSKTKVGLPHVEVQTDLPNEFFKVQVRNEARNEPSEFKAVDKLFILSDIEGNFNVLKNLLKSNGVIDSNFNWTFGNGHLVFNGDMFDRGEQVTECLWLMYHLEQEAKNKGGYVHFILGNHEIMNLSGDNRYTKEKYLITSRKIGRTYSSLFDNDTVLGRWLRSKNIIEKIGNLVFTHAGISKEVSDLLIPISNINEIARQYYDKDMLAKLSSDTSLAILYSPGTSPFWYRNYYFKNDIRVAISASGLDTTYKPSVSDIDEILDRFNASKIITGHSIVADTISLHYGGKIINTDTKHADGKSEALLIVNNKYFRVNVKGERFILELRNNLTNDVLVTNNNNAERMK